MGMQEGILKKEKTEWSKSAKRAGIPPEIQKRVSARFDQRMQPVSNPRIPRLKAKA